MAETLRTEDVEQTAMAVLMFVLAERSSDRAFLDGFEAYEGVADGWYNKALPAARARAPADADRLEGRLDANLELLRPPAEAHESEITEVLRHAGVDPSSFAPPAAGPEK
jgi:hypothetical protein